MNSKIALRSLPSFEIPQERRLTGWAITQLERALSRHRVADYWKHIHGFMMKLKLTNLTSVEAYKRLKVDDRWLTHSKWLVQESKQNLGREARSRLEFFWNPTYLFVFSKHGPNTQAYSAWGAQAGKRLVLQVWIPVDIEHNLNFSKRSKCSCIVVSLRMAIDKHSQLVSLCWLCNGPITAEGSLLLVLHGILRDLVRLKDFYR